MEEQVPPTPYEAASKGVNAQSRDWSLLRIADLLLKYTTANDVSVKERRLLCANFIEHVDRTRQQFAALTQAENFHEPDTRLEFILDANNWCSAVAKWTRIALLDEPDDEKRISLKEGEARLARHF